MGKNTFALYSSLTLWIRSGPNIALVKHRSNPGLTLSHPTRRVALAREICFLGLEYFHEYLGDGYSAKEQMRRGFSWPRSKTAFPYLSIDGKAVE